MDIPQSITSQFSKMTKEESSLKIRLIENSTTAPYNPIYIGMANPGTLPSTKAWQIIKLAYDTNGSLIALKFAGGTAGYTTAWVDRADVLIEYS